MMDQIRQNYQNRKEVFVARLDVDVVGLLLAQRRGEEGAKRYSEKKLSKNRPPIPVHNSLEVPPEMS